MKANANVDMDLLAYLEGFITPERKERFLEVLALRTRFLTVALEDVYQLHNASAVIRSCDVFGIQDVHLIEARHGRRVDKNIAMGAQQWVEIHRHETTAGCIKSLRRKGYSIVATVPSESATAPAGFHLRISLYCLGNRVQQSHLKEYPTPLVCMDLTNRCHHFPASALHYWIVHK